MNMRSLKLIAINASAEGTSGQPNRCMLARSGRSSSRPSCSRRYATRATIHGERPGEVPDDHAERSLVEAHHEHDRRADRDRHVGEARGEEARRRAARRGRPRSAARSSSAPRGRRTDARTSHSSPSSESASAIGAANAHPATSPKVAAAIVYQKLVRSTVRRRSGSGESNQKRKNALETPPRRIVTRTAFSAIRTPTSPRSLGSRYAV